LAVIIGIQARLSSTRLPRKVLLDLCGKTMLQRVLECCWGPFERIVLTSTDPSDDGLEMWLKDQGVAYRRGSLDNVLSRYTDLVQELHPSVLVRVCADAPFLEKRWIFRAVDEVEDKKHPCFIPGALHAGSSEHWMDCEEECYEGDKEHAGYSWFQDKGKVLHGLVPEGYFTVNTAEDLERARGEYARRKQLVEGAKRV
jgi:GTP:adenosylcobinamide-phosphate guanylyltransferase